MSKRHLHHTKRIAQRIKPGYILGMAIISGVVCVYALRANNEHMVTLRTAVYAADQNNGDTATALKNLQSYVTAHMNTNLTAGNTAVYPPIQLKYTYDRLVQAQSDALAKTNTQLYSAAQAYCEKQNSTDFSGHNRVPCIESYVESHGVTLPQIPDALYKFSFATPSWSPDLAGWSLLVTVVSSVLFVGLVIARRF